MSLKLIKRKFEIFFFKCFNENFELVQGGSDSYNMFPIVSPDFQKVSEKRKKNIFTKPPRVSHNYQDISASQVYLQIFAEKCVLFICSRSTKIKQKNIRVLIHYKLAGLGHKQTSRFFII